MKSKCNAKINIGLKVVVKKNGYHLIESTFVPINIFDYIDIEESDYDEIVGMDINIEDNLIYKAISLLRNKYHIEKHFKVKIIKNIPIKAGLGGGSSDAACVLKAINEMMELKISNHDLANLGLEIGSDVPFFIYNKPSIVTGIGECIKEIKDFKKVFGVLIFDDLYFDTKTVYDIYDEIRDDEILLNDLEKAARTMANGERILLIEKDLLQNGAYLASLTGSGGAVFGLFTDEGNAKEVADRFKHKYRFVESFESLM